MCMFQGLGGTPLPKICEIEVKLMDADALLSTGHKRFPHELLIGSDGISRGNGKIDYRTWKVKSFGQNSRITPYADLISHEASRCELSPPLHR